MRLLIDGNVLLDVLQRREPFYRDSATVWKLCETEQAEGFVSALTFADLTLDRDACVLRVGDGSCSLSHREMQLLEFFMRNPRVYLSADTLLDRVWGMDTEVEQGTVWVHISYLRRKLGVLGAHAVISSKLEETP